MTAPQPCICGHTHLGLTCQCGCPDYAPQCPECGDWYQDCDECQEKGY